MDLINPNDKPLCTTELKNTSLDGLSFDVSPIDNQGYNIDMDMVWIRNKNPFLPILPWPASTRSVVFHNASAETVEVQLPDNVKFITFTASQGFDFAVSAGGIVTGLDTATASGSFEGNQMVNPDPSTVFYVKELRNLSFRNIGAKAGFVTVNCYIQR